MTAFRVPVTMLAAPALSSQSLAYDQNDHLALTTDIQYMKDLVDENGAKGWIFELRAVSELLLKLVCAAFPDFYYTWQIARGPLRSDLLSEFDADAAPGAVGLFYCKERDFLDVYHPVPGRRAGGVGRHRTKHC